MKKYYPKLYGSSNSVIDEWANYSLYAVKQEVLEINPKASSIFWV